MLTAPPRLVRLAIAATALAAVSCSSERSTFVPDGRHGYMVTCGGITNSWSTCLVKAGRACGPHGYDTIQSSEEDRNLLIACK